jgi:hypothetical protein
MLPPQVEEGEGFPRPEGAAWLPGSEVSWEFLKEFLIVGQRGPAGCGIGGHPLWHPGPSGCGIGGHPGDVGKVKAVGEIGPVWSVGSPVQRRSRNVRGTGEVPEIRICIRQGEGPRPKSSPVDRLVPELIQMIAVTELMLGKWREAPEVAHLHPRARAISIQSRDRITGGRVSLGDLRPWVRIVCPTRVHPG